jgi:hypothetical protein
MLIDWVLDLHTSTDRYRVCGEKLCGGYMDEARKYHIKPAGLQELIKLWPGTHAPGLQLT